MNQLEKSFTTPVNHSSQDWFLNELTRVGYSAAQEKAQQPEIPQQLVDRLSKTTQPIPEVGYLLFHINNSIEMC